jgi:hypothetical protein
MIKTDSKVEGKGYFRLNPQPALEGFAVQEGLLP